MTWIGYEWKYGQLKAKIAPEWLWVQQQQQQSMNGLCTHLCMRDITTNRYWFDLLFLLHLIIVKWTDIVHSYWKGGWGGLRYYRNITYSRYELWWPVFHMAISMNFDAVSITNSIEWNVAISMLVWGGGENDEERKGNTTESPNGQKQTKKNPTALTT